MPLSNGSLTVGPVLINPITGGIDMISDMYKSYLPVAVGSPFMIVVAQCVCTPRELDDDWGSARPAQTRTLYGLNGHSLIAYTYIGIYFPWIVVIV